MRPKALGVDGRPRLDSWRAAADRVAVPFDEDKQVHSQDKDFTSHAVWDFERTREENGYPLLLNATYFDIYRKQVVKQADLVLALHWCGDQFTPEEKARAFAYYEPLTVRDSSLSACTQSIVAAEVGQLELAADYLAEAALMDLHDLERNTRDGLHIASLAGSWLAVVAGFGGMRDHGGRLALRPQLPPNWTRLCFRLRWRGALIRVVVGDGEVTYDVRGPEPIEIIDCGQAITVREGEPVTRPLSPVAPSTPRPDQPAGRSPDPDGRP